MSFPRWYPSVTLLPNQKIMVMGGTQLTRLNKNKYYEIWVRTRRWLLLVSYFSECMHIAYFTYIFIRNLFCPHHDADYLHCALIYRTHRTQGQQSHCWLNPAIC